MVNIPDGDTFRARHTPGAIVGENAFADQSEKKKWPAWRYHLKTETLLFRLCAIDAPETAKLGLLGQPFANEATQYLRDRVFDKVVLVKLIGRDQYGRGLVVLIVEDPEMQYGCIPAKRRRDVGEELVQVSG